MIIYRSLPAASAAHQWTPAIIVRFRDYPNGLLAALVLRQGPEVEVLSPPELADWVAELAHRVAAAHGGATFPRKRRRRSATASAAPTTPAMSVIRPETARGRGR